MSYKFLSVAACVAVSAMAAPALADAPKVEAYGTLPDGQNVQEITLRNANGMTVKILTLGGIITEISVPDAQGNFDNVVLTKDGLAGYLASANYSSLLGRYANRISGNGFTLDGVRHDLVGGNESGLVLHGGPDPMSQQLWKADTFGRETGPSGVVLGIISPDGENGFPGNLAVNVRYTLTDDDTLRLDYVATTDAPTVLNLSHHVYFNLAGEGPADDQCVQILADKYAQAESRIMTGKFLDVGGTALDLRSPTRLGDRVYKGFPELPRTYDTPYATRTDGSEIVPVARAWDARTGRTLEMESDQVSVQFFTPGYRPAGQSAGATADPTQIAGYAIETEHFPDSPNRPEFPSTVLRPGEAFQSSTVWKFGTYQPAGAACPVQ